MPETRPQLLRRRRARPIQPDGCPCCHKPAGLYWRCRCGFAICQTCMSDNTWGMTCNGITWTCPDCGASNSYGNQ